MGGVVLRPGRRIPGLCLTCKKMMFMKITEQDYRTVIGESALSIVSQASAEVRANAERMAQEEMSGYLRPRYDVAAVFGAEGEGRNPLVVMYLCDIALYNMAASLPQKMGMDVRQMRYERAVGWLEEVSKGNIVPDLPVMTDESGETVALTTRWGSEKRQGNVW